jgi:hypothetical protein
MLASRCRFKITHFSGIVTARRTLARSRTRVLELWPGPSSSLYSRPNMFLFNLAIQSRPFASTQADDQARSAAIGGAMRPRFIMKSSSGSPRPDSDSMTVAKRCKLSHRLAPTRIDKTRPRQTGFLIALKGGLSGQEPKS